MRTLITTVGTSVLTNHSKWKSGSPLPDVVEIDNWLATADPVLASAETHSWFRLGILNGEECRIVLVHSHTAEGIFAAERLKVFAENHLLQAVTCEAQDLDHGRPDDFNRGLSSLARVICEEKTKADKHGYAEIVATGGFKAEAAVANLVGTILRVPVHYLHESFRQIVTLDPMPVGMNIQWLETGPVRTLIDLFLVEHDHCLAMTDTIRSLIRADERIAYLIESATMAEGSMVAPTALGEIAIALRGQAPESWPPTCDTSPNDKIALDADHHKPHGWKAFLERLALSSFTTHIRFDGTAGNRANMHIGPMPGSCNDLAASISDQRSPPLRLRVTTTATTIRQLQMISNLLRKELGIKSS